MATSVNPTRIDTTRASQISVRLAALGVREPDLEEIFVRSGGHGGQNVNKTSTCVMLLHRPTGVRVKCQESRHQGMNRLRARELLAARLEALSRERLATARAAKEKLRRQTRGRGVAAKQRILADKARHSSRKNLRRRPVEE